MLILEAWSKEDVIKNLGADIQKFIDKNKLKDSVSDLVDKSMKIDPSTDKKYVGSIVRWLIQKRPEDLEAQIKPLLTDFHKLLEINSGKFGNASKQIIKGKMNLDELSKLVKSNSDLLDLDSGSNIKLVDALKNFKKIAEDSNFYVYKIDKWIPAEGTGNKETGPKHICFTGNVDWCVKYKTAFNSYGVPYFLFVNHRFEPIYLYHKDSGQFKNVNDEPAGNDAIGEVFQILETLGLPNADNIADMDDLRQSLFFLKRGIKPGQIKDMIESGKNASLLLDYLLVLIDNDYRNDEFNYLLSSLFSNYSFKDIQALNQKDVWSVLQHADSELMIKISKLNNFVAIIKHIFANKPDVSDVLIFHLFRSNKIFRPFAFDYIRANINLLRQNKYLYSQLQEVMYNFDEDGNFVGNPKLGFMGIFKNAKDFEKQDLKFLKSLVQPTVTESIYAKSNWLLG